MQISNQQIINQITQLNYKMKVHALNMALSAGSKGAHLGGALSAMEIIASLYGGVMKHESSNPTWEARDRFILSKGHAVLAYYSALAESGYFSIDELNHFELDGSFLGGHPVIDLSKGIEYSSGSLGMGLSYGAGIALSSRLKSIDYRVYVMLGDGECNEGEIWEAAMFAAHNKLGNLIAIVDRNHLQYDGTTEQVLSLENFHSKWSSFGWHVAEIDGHNIEEIVSHLLDEDRPLDKPYVIIANTIKGNGISFMENQKEWHHNRLTEAQYKKAMEETIMKYDSEK